METNSTSAVCAITGDCGTGVAITPTVRDPNASVGSGGADVGYTGPTVAEIIDALAGVIEFSHLAQSLRTRIDVITNLEAGFNNLQSLVVTDNSVMAQQLIGLRDDLTNAVAYINTQTNIQISEREALVNSVNQMVAQIDGGGTDGWIAALQEESTVRAAQTGALFAEKTVKTDLAGNVAGYGLSSYADPSGAVSEFRVAADRFSFAPPAYVSATPPPAEQMHDGKVWVDTSQGSEAAVTKWWSSATASWSLTPVKAAQPFIYLTTPTTLPDGTVVDPGLYVNSANITKLRADQIDTRGLTIKDAAGQVIFAAGTGLDWDEINGTNKPEDGATRNVFRGNWGTAITYTYGDIVLDGGNGWRAVSTHTSNGTNKPPASGTGNTWWALYTIKGDTGSNGLDGLTIVAPNSSHTLPASSAGVVSSYTGSGTTIEVFDGATAVNAVSSITANNQFTVGTPVVTGTSTISPGARTYSGTVATVAQHGTMSAAGTISIITYPITVRRSNGTNVNLSFQQTLTKSLAGTNGSNGATGATGATGPAGQGQFRATAFLRSASQPATPTGGTYAEPTPAGWVDGIPAGTLPLWQATRIFTSNGLSPQQGAWDTPKLVANTSSVNYQFSTDNVNWSDTASTNSNYIRTGTSSDGGNTWTFSAGVLVKGEQGPKGDTGTQGIPGTPGANGVTLYTWVKYANDAIGTGISDSPSGKSYIGVAYNKTTATELDDPSLYTWALIKGDQGIQGPVGPQGSPTYTWIKYANDASGSGMSDDSTGKTHIGIAVNKSTATEGTVAADYTWALIQGPKGDPGTQGIPGTPGANGVTLYTWVKYANDPSDPLTDNPTGKNYIGIAYNKTTATESTVYGDYSWSLIKGDQGIPGPAGANGQPTYTWIKYADSATGTGMSDSPTNKTYIGVAVNKLTEDESGSVAADYTWSLIQGPKGDTGKGISTIVNTYQASNSGTVVPTGTWSPTIPALSNSAMFLWNREVITYTDNTTQTNHYMIGQKGADGVNGVNGVSLDNVIEEYQAGSSATIAPTGSWSTLIPALTDTNKFLWNRETFVYSDQTQDVFIKMIGQKGDKGDQGVQGLPGKDSISIDLSNDSHGVPCNIDGSDPVFAGATTTASVYLGAEDDSANWTWTTAVSSVNVSGTNTPTVTISGANTRTVTITGMSADTGFVDFTATKAGASTQTVRFSVYKAKGGSYWIVPSVDAIKKSAAGVYTPTTVTFNSRMAKADGTLVAYPGFFRIDALVGNTVQSTTIRNVAETSYAYTVPADITHVRASLYRAAGAVDLLDQETLAVVSDGATGATGASGQGQVKAVAFLRSVDQPQTPSGGSFANPTPSGWSDGIPSGVTPLWQSTRMFTSDSLAPHQAAWTTPQKVANTTSVRYEFSTVNTNNDADWSTTALVNSLYMRTGTSVDGGVTWTNTAGVLIKGEVGDTGPAGPAVVVLASRTPSFTSTDGVLDSGQFNIVFTAVLEGEANPAGATYNWTITGVTPSITFPSSSSVTLTAAQFGAATSAIVQCTVNGLSDQVAVHRLNKSTAAAGATVGADGSNLKTGAGVNMVFNGDYTDGTAGTYAGYYTSALPSLIGHNLESHTLQGEGTAYVYLNGTPAANSVFDADVFNGAPGKNFPVQAGKKYEAYAWLNSHRCAGVVSVVFYNSSGGQISQVQGNSINFQSGISTLADLRQSWGIFTAPVGAVSAKVIVRATATGAATPYLFFSRVYFGEAGAAQTESSSWSPGRGIGQITSGNASTYIADAAIGNAQIANASITSAKIGNAAVDTLSIKGNAVTIPGGANGQYSASVTLQADVAMSFMVIGTFTQGEGKGAHPWNLRWNGVVQQREIPNGGTLGAMSKMISVSAGTHVFGIDCEILSGDASCGITVIGAKR